MAGSPTWQTRALRCIKADLSVPIPPRVRREFEDADLVVNYASDSHVDRSIEEPRVVWENNTAPDPQRPGGSQDVRQPVPFFQISTDEVYGPPPSDYRYPEWSPIVPSNVYSASKRVAGGGCVSPTGEPGACRS
jgi:dTDP-glucose 4,6-dehydratase